MKRILIWVLLLVMGLSAVSCASAQELDRMAIAVEFLTNLMTGQTEGLYAQCTEDVQKALPEEALVTLSAQLEAQAGKFKSIGAEQAQQIGPTAYIPVEMENMYLVAQVSVNDQGQIQGLGFQPAEQPGATAAPPAENEETVEVGEYKLPGLLTLPKEGDAFPAVVLVHGSGPNDRNETLGNSAIFRDLAEGLSSQGIAVLRYDKRTYAMAQGQIPVTAEEIQNITVYDETVEDAVAAVELLRADPRIDPERIFVIGHSQGAMMAPTIANISGNVRGLVLMAGTVRSLAEVLVDQLTALDAKGFAADIALASTIKEKTEEEARGLTLLGSPAYSFWEAAQHDLRGAAAECEAPMLILQGSEDTQIYPDKDYPLWEAFVKEYPQKDITLKIYQGLGHAFTVGDDLSPDVLVDIAGWILAH